MATIKSYTDINQSCKLAEIKKRKKEWQYGSSIEAKYKKEECDDILSLLDTIEVKEFQKRNLYVVTRCEEHSDYVEKAFFSKEKAEEYCKQFEGNEDAYGRDITEIKVDCPTIEVKEVDFEKIWKEYFKYRGDVATVNVKHLAKHFFELGLSASNKAQKGEQL